LGLIDDLLNSIDGMMQSLFDGIESLFKNIFPSDNPGHNNPGNPGTKYPQSVTGWGPAPEIPKYGVRRSLPGPGGFGGGELEVYRER